MKTFIFLAIASLFISSAFAACTCDDSSEKTACYYKEAKSNVGTHRDYK